MTDWLAANWPWIVLVCSYPIGAVMHTTIANLMIQREAKRSRKAYMDWLTDQTLPAFKEELLAELRGSMQAVPSVDEIAKKASDAVALRLQSAAGVEARKGQTKLSNLLMQSTGNAMLDGAIALADPDGAIRRKYGARLAKSIRSGETELDDGEPLEVKTVDPFGWK